jgi:hypothetical protein
VEQLSPDIAVAKKITSKGILQLSGPILDIEGA